MNRTLIASALGLLAVAAVVPLAGAQDGPSAQTETTAKPGEWPQWRGPKRDNLSTETGLLKEWPADGPKLLWTTRKLGKGFSSVAVAEGKIFSMGDGPDGSYLFALNEADGKPLWSTKMGNTGEYGGYAGTRATPSYDDGFVYALNQHGDLICADAKSGKAKWRRQIEQEFKGTRPQWGYAESPLVDGDLVVCTPGGDGGTLLAVNKNTGKPVWRSRGWTDKAHYSSPVAADIGGRHQYVQLTDKSIAGIDAASGRVLWRGDRPGAVAVIPTPIVHENFVFVTSGYKVGSNLFEIATNGKRFDVRQVYQNTDMQNHHGGVVLLGEHLYGSSDPGILTCMEFKTGKVVWKNRSVGKGAVAYADGMLYLRSEEDGKVALVEATPEAYREKGVLEQPERSDAKAWPQPVIANGKLYLRDHDILLCYDVKAQ